MTFPSVQTRRRAVLGRARRCCLLHDHLGLSVTAKSDVHLGSSSTSADIRDRRRSEVQKSPKFDEQSVIAERLLIAALKAAVKGRIGEYIATRLPAVT